MKEYINAWEDRTTVISWDPRKDKMDGDSESSDETYIEDTSNWDLGHRSIHPPVEEEFP